MKQPNVRAIRNELPHGAITEIAEKVGLSQKQVSEFFTKGWHKEYSNAILTEAIEIIRGKYPDEELLEEAQDLGLTGGSSRIPYQRKKRKEKDDDIGFTTIAIGVGIAVALIKFWPNIQELFSGNKVKLTPAEAQAAEVAAAKTK